MNVLIRLYITPNYKYSPADLRFKCSLEDYLEKVSKLENCEDYNINFVFECCEDILAHDPVAVRVIIEDVFIGHIVSYQSVLVRTLLGMCSMSNIFVEKINLFEDKPNILIRIKETSNV